MVGRNTQAERKNFALLAPNQKYIFLVCNLKWQMNTLFGEYNKYLA